jgi:hypothetical protein
MRFIAFAVAVLIASPALADQTEIQRRCSARADDMNLHGAERMAFRTKCKGNGGYSVVATQATPNGNDGVRLGMTGEQVVGSSWGKPKSINTTITTRGKHAQWVYGGGQYVYLTDGVVTSIQLRRYSGNGVGVRLREE